MVAHKRGKLKKGGLPDLAGAAREILGDWCRPNHPVRDTMPCAHRAPWVVRGCAPWGVEARPGSGSMTGSKGKSRSTHGPHSGAACTLRRRSSGSGERACFLPPSAVLWSTHQRRVPCRCASGFPTSLSRASAVARSFALLCSALLCSALLCTIVASCAVASRMSHAVRCASLAREFDIGAIDAATTTMLDQMASTSGRTQPTQPHLRRTQPHLLAVQAPVPNVPPGLPVPTARNGPCAISTVDRVARRMSAAALQPWHVALLWQRRRPTASP